MGGSLSTILSDFVIEDLFDSVFSRIKKPKLLLKYVDDCFLIADAALTNTIIDVLNAQNGHINFIPRFEDENGTVTYLNISIHNTHTYEELITVWYTKEIASGRLINYHSAHPRSTIKNTVKSQIITKLRLTHPSQQSNIFIQAHRILSANDFPNDIANRIVKQARAESVQIDNEHDSQLDDFPNNRDPLNTEQMTEKERKMYISLPFIDPITPMLNGEIRLLHPECITSSRPLNTIKKSYDAHKNLRQLP